VRQLSPSCPMVPNLTGRFWLHPVASLSGASAGLLLIALISGGRFARLDPSSQLLMLNFAWTLAGKLAAYSDRLARKERPPCCSSLARLPSSSRCWSWLTRRATLRVRRGWQSGCEHGHAAGISPQLVSLVKRIHRAPSAPQHVLRRDDHRTERG
jgi:hypothetical protein